MRVFFQYFWRFTYNSSVNKLYKADYKCGPRELIRRTPHGRWPCVGQIMYTFRSKFTKIGQHLNAGISMMSIIFTLQCNVYAAQRTRRLYQMWNLYSKLYRDQNVKNLVKKLRSTFKTSHKPAGFLFSAALFNWENNKITDLDLQSCINDFDHIDQLISATDNQTTKAKTASCNAEDKDWQLLLNKDHLKIWRKPVQDSYLYEYKVYGSFYDIPSYAFFSVQMDLDYRKKWDKHINKLYVVDKNQEMGCEVIHWITNFPYPMYDREYVYIRKSKIDDENKVMVMSSKATTHPQCPVNKKSVRVEKYKSQLVIRPHKSFSEHGFDYVLTYFDDPQAVFPTVAYNWMATSGVSDFVDVLHNAAKKLHEEERAIKPYSHVIQPNAIPCSSTNQIPAYA